MSTERDPVAETFRSAYQHIVDQLPSGEVDWPPRPARRSVPCSTPADPTGTSSPPSPPRKTDEPGKLGTRIPCQHQSQS